MHPAIEIQKQIRANLKHIPLSHHVRTIAGADVSFNKYQKDVYAGIIVFSYPDLVPIKYAPIKREVSFPYIPGLLSFREIPPLLEAWKLLNKKPDVTMVDGHGIAHPRRLGIAAHFGLAVGAPTLGCAKNILYGVSESELGIKAGSTENLIDPKRRKLLGLNCGQKEKVKPVFISPGHLLSLENAIEITNETVHGYRLPEPTRQAHLLVNAFRKGEIGSGHHLY